MKVSLNDYSAGEFIRIIREWTGLTQKEFGKRIGRSARTIQEYESENFGYNIKTLQKISKEFNIVITAEKRRK